MTVIIQFDGIDDYLSISDASTSDGDSFTLRLRTTSTQFHGLLWDGSQGTNYLRINTSGELRARAGGTSGSSVAPPNGINLRDGDWHEITLHIYSSSHQYEVDGFFTSIDNADLTGGKFNRLFYNSGDNFLGECSHVEFAGGNTRFYDADASVHTAGTPIVTDTVSADNATGVNMPTAALGQAGSAWVDLGGGGVTVTVDLTISKPIFSAQASVTLPEPSSSVDLTISAPVFSAQASVTFPQPASIIDIGISKPVFSVSAEATLPSAASNISIDISKPVFSVDASATLPQPDSSTAIEISKPVFSVAVTVSELATSSVISFDVSKPVFSAQAAVTLPSPSSSIQFNIAKPVFSVTATVTGLDIVTADNAKITVNYGSNKISLITKSNTITLITKSNKIKV